MRRCKSTNVEWKNKNTIAIIRANNKNENKRVETRNTKITKKNKTVSTLRPDDM